MLLKDALSIHRRVRPADRPSVNCDLSIVVVNWNTRDLLAACLESIAAECANLTDAAIETIVVDNGSSDGSAGMVEERFPWVRLIANRENSGFARANNQGVRASSAHYVMLLNSDTVLHAGALRALLSFVESRPRAGAVGPLLLNADGSLQPSCHPMLTPGREFWRLLFLERFWPRATYPMTRWDREIPREIEVIKGACIVLRREALDRVGLLDESFFMYTEEVELCHRLAEAGWELWWEPRATVTHYGGASSRQMAEAMYLELYRSKLRFFRKCGGETAARRARRLLLCAYVPRWLAASALGRLRPSLVPRARTFRRLLDELPTM